MTQPIFSIAQSKGIENKIGHINPLERFGMPEEIGEQNKQTKNEE